MTSNHIDLQSNEAKSRPIHDGALRLEPISMAHVDGLFEHMSSSAITEFLAWEPHSQRDMTIAVVQNLIESHSANKGLHWTLLHKGRVCGLISLIDIRLRHLSWTLNRAELAYWLAPEYQGNGLMTKACSLVLKFAFETCRFHKVIVAHATKNYSSERLIRRLGFHYIGEERDAFQKHGVWHDMKHYEMINTSQY